MPSLLLSTLSRHLRSIRLYDIEKVLASVTTDRSLIAVKKYAASDVPL